MRAPKGFRKVETGIGGFWKPTKEGQSIQGVISHSVETSGRDGKKNTFHIMRLTVDDVGPIVTGGPKPKTVKPHVGLLVGVGGRVLHTFLVEHTGREVYIEYAGLGDAKPGQSAPKLFRVYESEEEVA